MSVTRFKVNVSSDHLIQKGFATVSDLLKILPSDLREQLDLDWTDTCTLISQVSTLLLAKRVQTADELTRSALSTGIQELDDHIGGILCGSLTEVAGRAGAGKSQFCLQCCIQSLLLSAGKVLYIDTENSFSAERLRQMTLKHPLLNPEDVCSSVKLINTDSCTELTKILDKLEDLVIVDQIQLIIIDSIANLVRSDLKDENQRRRKPDFLSLVASRLKFIAESFNIPVIITNQVAGARNDDSNSQFYTIALGNQWFHSVNTRLVLDWTASQDRIMKIVKTPSNSEKSFSILINNDGINS